MVHGNNNLRYAYFNGDAWTKSDIGPGTNCTIALDPNGAPYIGYNKSGQAWIAALQSDGTWQHELVDSTGGGRTMVRSDGSGALQRALRCAPGWLGLGSEESLIVVVAVDDRSRTHNALSLLRLFDRISARKEKRRN